MSHEKFAIPGFQKPTHPKFDGRVFAQADGLIEFMFLDNIPIDDPMPDFTVYISAERGREINRLAWTDTNRFVYTKRDDHNGTKSWWFRMRTDTLVILPGTYCFRFVVNGQEVTQKSITIRDHPALPIDPLDKNRCHRWEWAFLEDYKPPYDPLEPYE